MGSEEGRAFAVPFDASHACSQLPGKGETWRKRLVKPPFSWILGA
jgi:hypothetical protein